MVTVELDEVSLRMCARNPWSREMFDSEKITSFHGDCCEVSGVTLGSTHEGLTHKYRSVDIDISRRHTRLVFCFSTTAELLRRT